MARVFPYLGLSKKMGCLKLTCHEETERSNFLSVWKKGDALEKSTNYQSWGGVLREQKWVDLEQKYKWGFQGQYSEFDPETSWNHYEYREYDPIIGRMNTPDPMRQYWSSYIAMGNNPVNLTDPTGGETDCPECDASLAKHGALAEQYAVRASLWNKVSDYFNGFDFVLSGSAKIDAGIAAKFSEKVGSYSAQFDLNVVTATLFKGSFDLSEPTSSDAWGVEYPGDGKGVYLTNSIGIGVFKPSQKGGNQQGGLGLYAEQHQRVHGQRSWDYDNSAGAELLVKSYKSKPINGGKPAQAGGKLGKSKQFYGLDLGASAMFLLGGEVSVKIGFQR
jgi:RHS repeat-associated protein